MFARVQGTITWHRKTLSVSDAAVGVFFRMLGHCAEHLTDGAVPGPVAAAIASRSPGTLDELVAAEFLTRTSEGFEVVNYLVHNISRSEVEASRDSARERKQRSRNPALKRLSRVTDAVTDAEPQRDVTCDSRVTGRVTSASVTEQEVKVNVKEEVEEEEYSSSSHSTGVDLPTQPKLSGDVRRVFDHWRTTLGHDRAVLDDKRRRKIEAAIKSHGVETALAAIDGCASSDWHMGRDPNSNGKRFDDLTLILRDAEKIEKFAEMASTSRGQQSLPAAKVVAIGTKPPAVVFSDGRTPPAEPSLAERWAAAFPKKVKP
jgi:hypothetical protein